VLAGRAKLQAEAEANGLLAIDIDGDSAADLLKKLAPGKMASQISPRPSPGRVAALDASSAYFFG